MAREQLRQRGIPYFEDVEADIEVRLQQLGLDERKAFALAYAQRLSVLRQPLSPSGWTGWLR